MKTDGLPSATKHSHTSYAQHITKKMRTKLLYISAATLVALASANIISSSQASATENMTEASEDTTYVPAGGMTQVINPPVPRKIEFAGNTIDFDRMDMYERLDREISQMCYMHSSTMLMLKRANRFFPVIAPILKSNGVSEDLVYLACIESSLNQRAYSPAKAAGIWQFLASTAKEYGLEVNDYVDERYNIEKATAAAARYLKSAYNKYGNWESAMASYNGGQRRISTELESQLADSAFDLYLVEETSRYPFRVYAAKALMENPSKYGFHLRADQFYPQLDYTEVNVSSTIDDLAAWAQRHDTTYAMLREFNPWLRAKSLPVAAGKSYSIKVPKPESLSRSANPLTKKHLYNPRWAD